MSLNPPQVREDASSLDSEEILSVIRNLVDEQQQRHASEHNAILHLYNELSWNIKQLRERLLSTTQSAPTPRRNHLSETPVGGMKHYHSDLDDQSNLYPLRVTPQRMMDSTPMASDREDNMARDILDDMSESPSRPPDSHPSRAAVEDAVPPSLLVETPIPIDFMGHAGLDLSALRGNQSGTDAFVIADSSVNAPTLTASADASMITDEQASQDTLRALHELPTTTNVSVGYTDSRPHVTTLPGGTADESEDLPLSQPYHVLVEFKRHRTVQFESECYVSPGRYVLVQADRGEDLGLVTCTWSDSQGSSGGAFSTPQQLGSESTTTSITGLRLNGARLPSTLRVCRGIVLRRASESEVSQLHYVQAELERRAIDVCQQLVLERKVPMVLVDAEYQFDSKKLTFFYEAQQRTDFRELVRDLYKSFRARIWMEMVDDNESS